jgi:hypothetical protein
MTDLGGYAMYRAIGDFEAGKLDKKSIEKLFRMMRRENMAEDRYDVSSAIIAFEEGELTNSETVELFQHLVNTGMAWKLQGFYGRTAKSMIDAGLIRMPGDDRAVKEPEPDSDIPYLNN